MDIGMVTTGWGFVLAGLAVFGFGHAQDKNAGKVEMTGWKRKATGIGSILSGLGMIVAGLTGGTPVSA